MADLYVNDNEPILKKCVNNRIRLIGGLFLSAFVFYGGGTALVSSGQQILGLVLMLINSAVVLSIGVLISAIISRDDHIPQLFTSSPGWLRLLYLVQGLSYGLSVCIIRVGKS